MRKGLRRISSCLVYLRRSETGRFGSPDPSLTTAHLILSLFSVPPHEPKTLPRSTLEAGTARDAAETIPSVITAPALTIMLGLEYADGYQSGYWQERKGLHKLWVSKLIMCLHDRLNHATTARAAGRRAISGDAEFV